MDRKGLIRKKFFLKRKTKYFDINKNYFLPLINLIKRKLKDKKNISLYFPNSYEVNIFKIFEIEYFKNFNYSLPIIEKNSVMNFYKWKKNEILVLNKYGIPEPLKTKKIVPHIVLVPLLAFDNQKNRIGYGKGYYDRYLNKYFQKHKNILAVGVAFSFQKSHKLPVIKNDFRLDYIITEKGIF